LHQLKEMVGRLRQKIKRRFYQNGEDKKGLDKRLYICYVIGARLMVTLTKRLPI